MVDPYNMSLAGWVVVPSLFSLGQTNGIGVGRSPTFGAPHP